MPHAGRSALIEFQVRADIRDCAWPALVPLQISTGGRSVLGKTSKLRNRYLHPATSERRYVAKYDWRLRPSGPSRRSGAAVHFEVRDIAHAWWAIW